jgi:hypothetical protein
MAQMLVALRAVREAEAGRVSHAADAVDEMRERFLLYGVRAPFGWIARLRTYGKKIQNSTTSMGYIYWSEDEQTLSYKDLRLSMRGLREFVAAQVTRAQAELAASSSCTRRRPVRRWCRAWPCTSCRTTLLITRGDGTFCRIRARGRPCQPWGTAGY